MMANTLQQFAEEAAPLDLDQELEGTISGLGRENRARWGYWKKAPLQPDGSPSPEAGYIEVADAEDRALLLREEKGMVLLRQYGFFQKENPAEQWSMVSDKWKRILLRGGATEFPVKQLVEMGWHHPNRLPRYARKIKFPQLKGVKIDEAECPSCHRVFSSLDNAGELLAKHQQVAHRELSQTQNVARTLAEAQGNLTGPLADVVNMLARQVEAQGASTAAQNEALKLLAESVAEVAKQNRK